MAFKFSTEVLDSPRIVSGGPMFASWQGIDLTVARENIEEPTVWRVKDNRHALIVHLGGKIDSIETEIDRRASKLDPPTDGEFWLIPANSDYFSYTKGDSVSYAEFYFDTRYLQDILGENARNYELLPHVGQFDNFLFHNVKELVSLMSRTDDVSKLIGNNVSQTICLYLFSNFNKGPVDRSKRRPNLTVKKFSILREYIRDNLSNKITLEDLAKVAETSPHNLLRSFSSSFGRTPAQYIIHQRLRKARWLLANSTKDITTIAFETGFSSHSHLSTTFKKNLDITPQDFRLQY